MEQSHRVAGLLTWLGRIPASLPCWLDDRPHFHCIPEVGVFEPFLRVANRDSAGVEAHGQSSYTIPCECVSQNTKRERDS